MKRKGSEASTGFPLNRKWVVDPVAVERANNGGWRRSETICTCCGDNLTSTCGSCDDIGRHYYGLVQDSLWIMLLMHKRRESLWYRLPMDVIACIYRFVLQGCETTTLCQPWVLTCGETCHSCCFALHRQECETCMPIEPQPMKRRHYLGHAVLCSYRQAPMPQSKQLFHAMMQNNGTLPLIILDRTDEPQSAPLTWGQLLLMYQSRHNVTDTIDSVIRQLHQCDDTRYVTMITTALNRKVPVLTKHHGLTPIVHERGHLLYTQCDTASHPLRLGTELPALFSKSKYYEQLRETRVACPDCPRKGNLVFNVRGATWPFDTRRMQEEMEAYIVAVRRFAAESPQTIILQLGRDYPEHVAQLRKELTAQQEEPYVFSLHPDEFVAVIKQLPRKNE